MGPCQVRCEIDQGAGLINAAGNADTDADDRSIDTCLQLVDDVRHLCQYGAGVVTRSGATGRAKDGAVSVHDPGGDLRAADVRHRSSTPDADSVSLEEPVDASVSAPVSDFSCMGQG